MECFECKSNNYSNCGDNGYDKEKESCDDLSAVEKLAGIQQVCLKAVFEGKLINTLFNKWNQKVQQNIFQ